MPLTVFNTHIHTHTHVLYRLKKSVTGILRKRVNIFDFDILSQLECVNEMTDKS